MSHLFNPSAGKLIVFEGGEAVGKTTLIDIAEKYLKEQGLDVLRVRNPGGSPAAEEIRKILFEQPRHPKVELHLFIAAILDNYHEYILPALEEGKIVLCDRLYSSTIAYQIYGRQLNDSQLSIIQTELGDISVDLEFFISADKDIRHTRISNRKGNNYFDEESEVFMSMVDLGYKICFEGLSWSKCKYSVLNNGDIQEAVSCVQNKLQEFLKEIEI